MDMSTMTNYRPPEKQIANILNASTAREAIQHLREVIEMFETALKENEAVGVTLTSFGVEHTLVVEQFEALGTNLIVIQGTENNNREILVQHLSQLNFLLVPLRDVPRRSIGFRNS